MKNLLAKELRLAMHPTNLIFLSLSALLLAPGYPYYIIFFYTMLGIFFLCLDGRENHDIEFSLTLPVRKAEIVKARVLFAAGIELVQVLLTVPFAFLRRGITPVENVVGMDANLPFFGLSLLMLGLFNYLFFTIYYRNPVKVGKAFLLSGTAVMLYIVVAESLVHVAPFFRDVLDTPDPQFIAPKLAVLAAGAAGFALLTLLSYTVSARRFVTLDL